MQVILELTANCNQKCIHCAHRFLKRKKGNMDVFLFKKIIDEIKADTETWFAFYGESLLLKYKLYYMIEYAKHRGLINTVLNTNATLLNAEMSKMLIDSGLDRLIVSMDGFSKETYEKIRVGGVYEITLANVHEFIRQKNQYRPDMIFEMQFSVLEENQHEVEAFKKYWHEQGACVKVRPKASWAGKVEATFKKEERYPCKWALNHCAILWNGDMVACGVDCEGEFIAGNVRESSLFDLWYGKHKQFREIHIRKEWDRLPKVCASCMDWQTHERQYIE